MLEDFMKEASSPGFKSRKLYRLSSNHEERTSEIFEIDVKNSFFQAVATEDVTLVQNYVERFSLDLEMQDTLGNTALNMAT